MKRKEIVIQRDIKDCGPCCLLSIIHHYDGNVPLEKIRLDSYADIRGTSAYNLIKASENYGFEAIGLKTSSLEEVKSFPCIAHVILDNGLNHYMVIYSIKKTRVTVMDPAKGKVTYHKNDFLKIWDNIIITFHPKQKIIEYPANKNIVNFFINLILKDKFIYLKIIIFSIIVTLLNILLNLYLKIGNKYINNNSSFISLIIIFLLISFIKNSFLLFHNNNYIKLTNRVHKNLVSDFTFHIFSLPSTSLLNRSSGEIITRINELNDIKDLLSELVIGIILDGLLVINSGIVLLFLNKTISIYLIVFLGFYFILSLLSAKQTNYKLHKVIMKDTEYNENLLDMIDMYSSINNLQIKPSVNDNLNYHLTEKISEESNLKRYLNIINFLKGLLSDVTLITINSFALYLVFKGKMSMINLITFNTIYIYLFTSFDKILGVMPEYYYLKNSIYKISEFKSLEPEKNEGINSFRPGDLVIKNLKFNYCNNDYIIDGFNYRFKMSKSYFLNGKSGSGKSTLIKILYKDLNDYKGSIYINNKDYKDINTFDLKNNIVLANQQDKLFSGTIYQNIICFRNISENDFEKVCKICLIDKIVKKKPLRYFSNVKDSLTNLSGGEKQQIILARNLLKKGFVIIIDEALSEVDYNTEQIIINNIKKYYNDKLIIYVSHKHLSSLFDYNVTMPN